METAIEQFSKYFETRGRSAQTVRAYRKSLRQFVKENSIQHVGDITRTTINGWVLELRERSLKDGTIANHLWAIKAFLTWQKKEMLVDCYAFDIQIPKAKDPESVEYLEPEELEIIFSLIDTDDLGGMRLRTFIEVMINTGMRPGEALNLDIKELVGDEITIVGKGNIERKVYFNKRARYWIDAYTKMRTDTHPALFVTHPNRFPYEEHRISRDRVEEHFRKMFRSSGIQKRVTPHTLRHTYATTLLANGCPIDYVARLLGHRKCETTRKHYISIQHKHAKKAHFHFLSYDEDAQLPAQDNDPGDRVHALPETKCGSRPFGNSSHLQ